MGTSRRWRCMGAGGTDAAGYGAEPERGIGAGRPPWMRGGVEFPSASELLIKIAPGKSQTRGREGADPPHVVHNPQSVSAMGLQIDARKAQEGRCPCGKGRYRTHRASRPKLTLNQLEHAVSIIRLRGTRTE